MAHIGDAEPMTVEELLSELLDRVRDILNVDTAAVLLLEEGSDELVARAARGTECRTANSFKHLERISNW